MRFFQRDLCLLRLSKKIFAFFSAGTLPAVDKIKFLCVSFSGCFACCGSIKKIEVLFSGCFACCGQNKSYMRFFQRVLCLLRLSKKYLRSFQRVLCLLRLNKIIVAFFSAGIFPAADKIKVLCVSFSGCFACCGSIK